MSKAKVVAADVEDLRLKREIRLAQFEEAIGRFLEDRVNGDFLLMELRGRAEAFVQLTVHDGAVLGEVGSSGRLEIFVRNGDARRLLGMPTGSPVRVRRQAG